jgi:hypothetical protein
VTRAADHHHHRLGSISPSFDISTHNHFGGWVRRSREWQMVLKDGSDIEII